MKRIEKKEEEIILIYIYIYILQIKSFFYPEGIYINYCNNSNNNRYKKNLPTTDDRSTT